MVALAVDCLARVRASAVALADEALAHFLVAIFLVASLCKTNSCQLVQSVQTLHELLNGPHFFWVQKLLKKV